MKGNGGFTYAALLVIIFIISVTTLTAGRTLRAAARMEKEQELIWRGHQFRLAIKRYVLARLAPGTLPNTLVPGTVPYPSTIDDLMKDPKYPDTVRHLRKKYLDPITGKDDWVPIMENGKIKGFHSNSDLEPLKQNSFCKDDYKFEGKKRYSEWEFVYDPTDPVLQMGQTITTSTGATAGTTPGPGTGTTPGTGGGFNLP